MADIQVERREGDIGSCPMGAVSLGAGNIIMANASGYAVVGADTASCVFLGVSKEAVDNSAGSAGDKSINYWRKGVFKFLIAAAALTNVGDPVYIAGPGTVGLAATTSNDVPCGKIVEYIDATHVWVDIDREIS